MQPRRTPPAAARRLIDALRHALANPEDGDDFAAPLSASFGIAACNDTADFGLDRLIEHADAEMYADKRRRRRTEGDADLISP